MCCCRTLSFDASRLVVGLALLGLVGCGDGSDPSVQQDRPSTGEHQASDTAAHMPPVAAISDSTGNMSSGARSRVVAEPGSPEALLLEITRLIAAANGDAQRQRAAQEAAGESNPVSENVSRDAAAAAYRKRLEQIIELATQVVAATHLDSKQEQSFNNAVLYLSDARLELASAGDTSQAQLLMEDAESLHERDASSFAAAEAGHKVVELAGRMAQSLGSQDPDWLREYATQAKLFAERFPNEQNRAAMGLLTAGRLCDRFNLTDEARSCLELVQQKFASTVFSEQSAGMLRRLSLEGQPLELAGDTIDGGFADIEQYQGRVVLVVFWASTSPTFREQFPAIKGVEAQFAEAGLSIIGVNLDTDEASADRFITEQQIAWPQIFSVDPGQRAGRTPLARYYGVHALPTCWLVNRQGIVTNTRIPMDDLPKAVAELLK